MEILCRCAKCATQFKVDAKYSGRRAKCPRCATVTTVPLSEVTIDADSDDAYSNRFINAEPSKEEPTVSDIPDFQSQKTRSTAASLTGRVAKEKKSTPTIKIVESSPESKKQLRATRRSRSQVMWIASAAIVAVLLVIVGVVVLARSWSGFERDPVLVVDWPEKDRKGDAVIVIDGRRQTLPAKGELRFSLQPGDHRLLLRRRGFQTIEWPFMAIRGQTIPYRPVWESSNFESDVVRNSDGSTTAANDGTASPLGFPGWMQLFDAAKKRASEMKIDILMVFCGSDWHPQSIRMANEIFSNPKFLGYAKPRYVLVVIDSPRTPAGVNLIADSAQNQLLFRQYDRNRSDRLPHVVLADSKGLPYARDGAFTEGVDKYLQHLTLLQANRTERDQFIAAAQSGSDVEKRLKAAERALQWLRSKDIARFYLREIEDWLVLARRIDPQNESGRLEVFLDEVWTAKMVQGLNDIAGLKPVFAELEQWSRQHQFQDSDRAVRLHVLAAALLLQGLQDETLALEHFNLAKLYSPKDEKLRDNLSALSTRLKERDQISSGSGFLVSAAGHILTNHHVIEGPGKTVIRVPGTDQRIPATVVAFDEVKDVALLKVDPKDLGFFTPLILADEKVGRGTAVAAFGYPLGDVIGSGLKLTSGAITGYDEMGMLIVDVRINPGNSGGPLCDNHGNVIGMVSAKSRASTGVESYGMAIPSTDLRAFISNREPNVELSLPDSQNAVELKWSQVDEIVRDAVIAVLKVRK